MDSKEILDRSTKKFLTDEMIMQQELLLQEREKNLVLLHEGRDSLPKDLNSKLDRIQKFLNQLKSLQSSNREVLVNEAMQLNLKRHIEEVVKSLTQSKLSIKDQDTMIEICMLLHQRYEEFTPLLIPALEKQYQEASISEINKKRNVLRLFSELYLKGLFPEFKKIFKCLNELILVNPENPDDFINAMMVITDYLKTYGEIFFQILSKTRREAIENDYEVTIERHEFLNEKQKIKIQEYFKDYLDDKCIISLQEKFKVSLHMVQILQTLKIAQNKFEDNKKEVTHDDRLEQTYFLIRNDFEKLHAIVQELADVLDLPMPTFKIEEDKTKQTQMIIKKKDKEAEDEFYPFDDELQFKFYRELPDYSRFVIDQATGQGGMGTGSSDEDIDEMEKKLLKSQSKDQIDERAIEFIKQNCYTGYKIGRKRMAKVLFKVPRNSLSLLPFYARFTAIVHQYFKDLGHELTYLLEAEFNELYETNDVIKIETKIRNIRFLGELTKFQVCPTQLILEILKKCLDHFHGHNIEIITHMLETCGRYLLRTEDSQLKFNNLLDFLWRLKEKENISSKAMKNLEDAYFMCRPPQYQRGQVKKQEVLTVMQQYIKHLFLERLDKENLDKVVELIERLPWIDEEDFIFRIMYQLITSHAKFNEMDTIAVLLASFKEYHRSFVVRIIDQIIEEIIRGVEKNDFKDSQRRVAIMKFVSESYNYQVFNTETLFNLLYKLLNYDYFNKTDDDYMKSFDSLQDSFRIRLICTVLDSLGKYFNKGERRVMMDRFLFFFERYIYSKNYVLMDLEFMILDTFDNIRPKFIRFQSGQETEEAVNKIIEAENQGKDVKCIISQYQDYQDEQDDYYYEEGNEDYEEEGQDDQEEVDETAEIEEDEEVIKEQVKEQRQKYMTELEKQEVRAFDQEFNSLLQESTVQARKEGGNPLSYQRKEILIPFAQLKNKLPDNSQQQENVNQQNAQEKKSMVFSLITKKGNKTNIKQIEVPTNTYMVVKTKERMQLEEEEREKVKEQIMKMTQQIDEKSNIEEDQNNE